MVTCLAYNMVQKQLTERSYIAGIKIHSIMEFRFRWALFQCSYIKLRMTKSRKPKPAAI